MNKKINNHSSIKINKKIFEYIHYFFDNTVTLMLNVSTFVLIGTTIFG